MSALAFAVTAAGMAEPITAPAMCSGFGSFHSDTGKNPRPLASITLAEIRHLIDNPQQVDKARSQWLIPSTLQTRTFKAQEQNGEFWMLWADIDKNPPALDRLQDVLRECLAGADFEVYSSRSATADCPKWHVLIPLAEPLSGADWCMAQEVLNDHLQGAGIEPDRASEHAAQLCYLPNRGEFYQTHTRRKGQPFDALDALAFGAEIADKRDQMIAEAEALRQQQEAAKARREARTASGDNPDTIGAFNLSFTVDEVLQQAGYDQRGKTFRHPHSESGSFSASVKDGRVNALSPNDPLYSDGKGAHDAFSAFEVLFHRGDRKAALKDAGDNWLTIGCESWNKVKQREYAQAKAGATAADFEPLLGGEDGQRLLTVFDENEHAAQPFPPPFRGVMAAAVDALLQVAIKPQPDLTLLAALIGMASACDGRYALPSGMRLNLYGLGVVSTGEGKEAPRHLAEQINALSGGAMLGTPSSGQGLEDAMQSNTGTLLAIDEAAHFFAATEGGKAQSHLMALSANLLKLFSAGCTTYKTRERVKQKGIEPAREIIHPTLSLLGFSTPERMGRALTTAEIESGSLGRMLFAFGLAGVSPKRIRERLVIPDEVRHIGGIISNDFQDESEGNLAGIIDGAVINVTVTDEADTALVHLLGVFNDARRGHEDPFAKALLTRSVEKLERIAGVIAVWESPLRPVVTPEHVEWARQFVVASDAALVRFAADFMKGGEVQANAALIVQLIRRAVAGDYQLERPTWQKLAQQGKVSRSLLLKRSRLSAKDFNEAVDHLAQMGDIAIGGVQVKTGKEKTQWIGLADQTDDVF